MKRKSESRRNRDYVKTDRGLRSKLTYKKIMEDDRKSWE